MKVRLREYLTNAMQRFPCPFCGLRDEREFHYLAEAGKTRPDTTQSIDDETWANYLYSKHNTHGVVDEIWMHLTCREVFILRRNRTSLAVEKALCLRTETQ